MGSLAFWVRDFIHCICSLTTWPSGKTPYLNLAGFQKMTDTLGEL